eukprot:TRINITY_DN9457_c0_g1_i2.p1 TRINITY_DN9457_c0_g1~~TRINITY_DN9457_c0_g1_i2.p1  ORF type:complete len:1377 (+),score=145.83 TRINITY_DN9457_c0_g1_i2:75-4133(+)
MALAAARQQTARSGATQRSSTGRTASPSPAGKGAPPSPAASGKGVLPSPAVSAGRGAPPSPAVSAGRGAPPSPAVSAGRGAPPSPATSLAGAKATPPSPTPSGRGRGAGGRGIGKSVSELSVKHGTPPSSGVQPSQPSAAPPAAGRSRGPLYDKLRAGPVGGSVSVDRQDPSSRTFQSKGTSQPATGLLQRGRETIPQAPGQSSAQPSLLQRVQTRGGSETPPQGASKTPVSAPSALLQKMPARSGTPPQGASQPQGSAQPGLLQRARGSPQTPTQSAFQTQSSSQSELLQRMQGRSGAETPPQGGSQSVLLQKMQGRRSPQTPIQSAFQTQGSAQSALLQRTQTRSGAETPPQGGSQSGLLRMMQQRPQERRSSSHSGLFQGLRAGLAGTETPLAATPSSAHTQQPPVLDPTALTGSAAASEPRSTPRGSSPTPGAGSGSQSRSASYSPAGASGSASPPAPPPEPGPPRRGKLSMLLEGADDAPEPPEEGTETVPVTAAALRKDYDDDTAAEAEPFSVSNVVVVAVAAAAAAAHSNERVDAHRSATAPPRRSSASDDSLESVTSSGGSAAQAPGPARSSRTAEQRESALSELQKRTDEHIRRDRYQIWLVPVTKQRLARISHGHTWSFSEVANKTLGRDILECIPGALMSSSVCVDSPKSEEPPHPHSAPAAAPRKSMPPSDAGASDATVVVRTGSGSSHVPPAKSVAKRAHNAAPQKDSPPSGWRSRVNASPKRKPPVADPLETELKWARRESQRLAVEDRKSVKERRHSKGKRDGRRSPETRELPDDPPLSPHSPDSTELWMRFKRALTERGTTIRDISSATEAQLMVLLEDELGMDYLDALKVKTMWQKRSTNQNVDISTRSHAKGMRVKLGVGGSAFATVRDVLRSNITASVGYTIDRITQLTAAAGVIGRYTQQRSTQRQDARVPKMLFYASQSMPKVSEVLAEGFTSELRREGGLLRFSTEARVEGCESGKRRLLICEVLCGESRREKGSVGDPSKLAKSIKAASASGLFDSVAYDYRYTRDDATQGKGSLYVVAHADRVLPRFVATLAVDREGAADGGLSPASVRRGLPSPPPSAPVSPGPSALLQAARTPTRRTPRPLSPPRTGESFRHTPGPGAVMCPHHPTEELRLFSHGDEELTCAMCASVGRHRDQRVSPLVDVLRGMHGQFTAYEASVADSLRKSERRTAALALAKRKATGAAQSAREAIGRKASAARQNVAARERALLDQASRRERTVMQELGRAAQEEEVKQRMLREASVKVAALLKVSSQGAKSDVGISRRAADFVELWKLLDQLQGPVREDSDPVRMAAQLSDWADEEIAAFGLRSPANVHASPSPSPTRAMLR